MRLVTWSLFDIAEAVKGELINTPAQDIEITGIHHDSRELTKNSIFIPIIAQRNGHDFIQDAIDKGAAAAFWSEKLEKAPSDIPLIKVDDTEKAFREFGRWYLRKVNPKVIGITGSNGKTTTKDMTAAVLSQKYKTHKTLGNENNQLGVPKTLLNMPQDTEMLVLEMGMSAPGEITILSKVTCPDAVAITMVGESHIQAFGSREKLTDEKMSILDGLKEGGLFIHPYNEPLISNRAADSIRQWTFGLKEKNADIYAFDIIEEIEKTKFSVALQADGETEEIDLTIPVPGNYNVNNALIAILLGQEFGVSLSEAKEGLEHFELTESRLEWLEGKKGTRLLNDAYNASPTSVKAALAYFSNITTDGGRIAVLGDILELGEQTKVLHESIAEAVDLEKYKALLLYGEEMSALYRILKKREGSSHVLHFTGEKKRLMQELEKISEPGDVVLFKSSNGTDLLSVVEQFKVGKE